MRVLMLVTIIMLKVPSLWPLVIAALLKIIILENQSSWKRASSLVNYLTAWFCHLEMIITGCFIATSLKYVINKKMMMEWKGKD